MIWQDKAFLAGYFLAVMVGQCYWQKALFKKDITINKRLHAFYYCLTILPMMYFFMPVWWRVVAIAITERLALFDFLLNKIRGKSLWYNGKGTTNSLQDKIENKLSTTWVKVLKVVYVLIFITVLIAL